MKKLEGLLLISPAAVLIFMVMVIPMGYTVYCSLFNLDYLKFGGFTGMDNYTALTTKQYLRAVTCEPSATAFFILSHLSCWAFLLV